MKERRSDIRKQLLRRDGPGCQAEVHQEDCPCQDCRGRNCQRCKKISIDHFLPRAVAKVIGMSNRQVSRLENLQMLSIECHRKKDSETPGMTEELRQQKRGRFIHFGEHRGLKGTIYET